MESSFIKNLFKKARLIRGYTLLELLVVLAIIGILSVVIVVGQKNFTSSTLLSDTAYTVALSVREAQTLGLSTRYASGYNNAGFGVHFGDTATSYVEFADIYPAAPGIQTNPNCPGHSSPSTLPDSRPGNCYYDQAQNELVQTYKFSNGYTISKICYLSSTYFCVTPGGSNTLDIVFERPNNQAVITFNSATLKFNGAAIDIVSPQGGKRCVKISSAGEIYVDTSCPS